MRISYYGHACFSIEYNGSILLTDPFITPNELAKGMNMDAIKADYILLTHGHQDHLADLEKIAHRTGALLISNFELVSHFSNLGVNGHPMNHGGKKTFEFGTVKMVQAVHSSVLPDGSNGGNPAGFVIWDKEEKNVVYIAGDTALTMDMKLIPLTCPPLDVAILPIGDNFTMGYEDAVLASDFVECDQVIGCHYDTFGYIKIDHEAARQAFIKKNKELILLEIGETQII